jgi:hypothetical protein
MEVLSSFRMSNTYERKYPFTVSIANVGTVDVYATDKFHAVELAYSSNNHRQADRTWYSAKRKHVERCQAR